MLGIQNAKHLKRVKTFMRNSERNRKIYKKKTHFIVDYHSVFTKRTNFSVEAYKRFNKNCYVRVELTKR